MGKFSSREFDVILSSDKGSRQFKNLHISAKVIRTLAGVPSTCELSIYNLSKESRDFLSSIYDEDGKSKMEILVTLDGKSFFSGNVINANSIRTESSAEWITTIWSADGWNAYRAETKYEAPKGTTRSEIVNSLIDELEQAGVATKGIIEGLRSGCGQKSILKRLLVEGGILENIKKLVNDCIPETDVFIDENALNILPKDLTLESVIKIEGLLDAPTLNEQGINAKILFNPNIKAGGKITIEARSYRAAFGNLTTNRPQRERISGEGTYKVIQIVHTVDNYSQSVARTEILGLFI